MSNTTSYSEPTRASIFVVEDEGLIALNIASTLRKAGYDIAGIAGSGDEALQKLAAVRPQLILMDIHLSGRMDGIELAAKVRELHRIPIIYLTAHSDSETLNRAKITEPFGYLAKPVQQTNLFTSIEVALFKHGVESDLRQQRGWLNTILGTMSDGVIVTDNAGKVQFLNACAESLTGWKAENVKGRLATEVLAPVTQSVELSLSNLIADAIAQNQPIPLPPGLHAGSLAGTPFPVEGEIAPSVDERGAIGAVITFRDASQRRKEEQDIRHDQKMLAVGRLAAGVAHDFNNLLTVIVGTTETALNSVPANHELAGPLLQIMQAAETASSVTRKLLTFSSKKKTEAQIVDWNTIIRSHEGLCRHLLGPNIPCAITLAPDLGSVYADPTALAEILINLISNARDAMPAGGRLSIETANVELMPQPSEMPQSNRYVSLVVEDSGTGMDASTAEHLFEPFFTTKCGDKGTGLGLSIVDGIVRELGGNIDVDSEPGLGSTFTIYLPCVSETGNRPPSAVESPHERAAKKTVLVVDDDSAVRGVLVSQLDGQGFRIIEAESGAQALLFAEAQARPIDLLITDVLMPNMDGRQLSHKLRLSHPCVKTLFVSGFSGEILDKHKLDLEGSFFLHKPFRQTQLLDLVYKLLTDSHTRAHHS